MPIASASFLIGFATLEGSADLTQPHGGGRPQIAAATHATGGGAPLGPSDKIRGCAPSKNMCDEVADACIEDGLDPDVCEGFRLNVCPADRAMSCKALEKVCQGDGNACEHINKTCDENLKGCGPSKCREAGTLTPGQAVATCYAYPSQLGICEGDEPSAGHCMSLLTWVDCGISTCEWIECQEELDSLGPLCPEAMPSACTAVMTCDAAEQTDYDGSCCEEHGNVMGKLDTCSISEGSFCVGCSYEPVLCMTHGCATPGEEDCCLSPEGETVPC